MNTSKLQDLLKRSFGFDSFRPLQREIMEDSLAGRDVFALLPTGGGKSLDRNFGDTIRISKMKKRRAIMIITYGWQINEREDG